MRAVTTALPQLQLHAPCVLIGGTNGKGTTAGFLFSLLSKIAGLKVGLYTSPHVSNFCERIQTSHIPLDDTTLLNEWQKLETLLTPCWHGQLTFFECTTLLSFHVFNNNATDINVLEVGLGGTWDAVNICEPLAAAIVSIGTDHQQYLGTTYRAILADKIGIARPHRPLFWGKQGSGANDSGLHHTLQKIVTQKQLTLFSAGHDFKLNPDHALNITLPDLPPLNLPLPLHLQTQPHWLQHNFCLASALHWWLLHYPNLSTPNFTTTTSHNHTITLPPHLPARFQLRHLHHRYTKQKRPLLLDACHNYDGTLALVTELKTRYHTVTGMLSLLHDKEINKIIPLLASRLKPLAIFALKNERSMIRSQLPTPYRHLWYNDFTAAWHNIANKHDTHPLVICGSFYGLGEALNIIDTDHEWELR